MVYFGKLTYNPKGCVKCGVVNHSTDDIVKNGTKMATIKLININFKIQVVRTKKTMIFYVDITGLHLFYFRDKISKSLLLHFKYY